MTAMDTMPVVQFLLFYCLSGLSLWTCLIYNLCMHAACGHWVAFTTLSATHHHPHSYHAGDYLHPSRDWGIQQIDSQGEVRKSGSLFLIAATFGDHLLHHFFPTVDHSKLRHLYPALEETLDEFGLEYEFEGFWKMLKGMHTQMRKDYALDYRQRKALRGNRSS